MISLRCFLLLLHSYINISFVVSRRRMQSPSRYNPTPPINTAPNPPAFPRYTLRPSSWPGSSTEKPTMVETQRRTIQPTKHRSSIPTKRPSTLPTFSRSKKPTSKYQSPFAAPTNNPVNRTTNQPFRTQSSQPTRTQPSTRPAVRPTVGPTKRPIRTLQPTLQPRSRPTRAPTSKPSNKPTLSKTRNPTTTFRRPTVAPTNRPVYPETNRPTKKASKLPTISHPTSVPSIHMPTIIPHRTLPPSRLNKPSSLLTTSRPTTRNIPSMKPILNVLTSNPKTIAPTSRNILTTSRPTTNSGHISTYIPSFVPSKISSCAVDATGDFGNVSNSNQASNVDFNYQMIVNTTILNSTGYAIPTIVHQVEIAVTNLILNDLFSDVCSSVNSTIVSDGRYRRTTQRFLASNDQIIGISPRPDDVISFNQCAAVNAPIPTDATCYLVFSRLTVYTSDPSFTSSITEVIIRLVSEAMNNRQLDKTNAAIIQLVYYNESDKGIQYSSSSLTQEGWPIIVGVILGSALLVVLLLLVLIRRRRKTNECKDDIPNDRLCEEALLSDIIFDPNDESTASSVHLISSKLALASTLPMDANCFPIYCSPSDLEFQASSDDKFHNSLDIENDYDAELNKILEDGNMDVSEPNLDGTDSAHTQEKSVVVRTDPEMPPSFLWSDQADCRDDMTVDNESNDKSVNCSKYYTPSSMDNVTFDEDKIIPSVSSDGDINLELDTFKKNLDHNLRSRNDVVDASLQPCLNYPVETDPLIAEVLSTTVLVPDHETPPSFFWSDIAQGNNWSELSVDNRIMTHTPDNSIDITKYYTPSGTDNDTFNHDAVKFDAADLNFELDIVRKSLINEAVSDKKEPKDLSFNRLGTSIEQSVDFVNTVPVETPPSFFWTNESNMDHRTEGDFLDFLSVRHTSHSAPDWNLHGPSSSEESAAFLDYINIISQDIGDVSIDISETDYVDYMQNT